MRSFVIVVCLGLALACSVVYGSERAEINLAAAAIREVLVQYFIANCPKIDLVIAGTNESTELLATKVLQAIPDGISIQVSRHNELSTYKQLNTSTILLYDAYQFSEIGYLSYVTFQDQQGISHKHLTYAPGLTVDLIMNYYNEDRTINDVGFLIHNEGNSIELSTSYLFSRGKCYKNQFKTINRFSRKTRKWENSNFYIEKYEDFNGCPLLFGQHKGRTNSIGQKIYEVMAQKFQYEAFMQHFDNDEEFNNIRDSYTTNEVAKHDEKRSGGQMLSSAIYLDKLTFVVPPGKPLTDLERMFAAFDEETWIGIAITFAIALVVILFIKFLPLRVQVLVFGRDIKTPILNLFDIFLNGGQNREPTESFSRYLLTMFILWSLIFRTCYQSMMFEHMRSDMRHPRVTSIDELIEKNFTLLYYENETELVVRYSHYPNRKIIPDDVKWYEVVPEPANKCTYLTFRLHYWFDLKSKYGKFVPSTFLLEEDAATIPFHMSLSTSLPFARLFFTKIDELLASGNVEKWFNEHWDIEKDEKHVAEEVEPEVLTVKGLRLGFLLVLICLMLSFVVFFLELALKAVKFCISSAVVVYMMKAYIDNFLKYQI